MSTTPEQPESAEENSIFTPEDFSMEGYDKHIRNARIILFVIAGLNLLGIFFIGNLPEPGKWFAQGNTGPFHHLTGGDPQNHSHCAADHRIA